MARTIDVAGCDRLFVLPRSVQPEIVITDGMIFAVDCLVLPRMSKTEAGMCLGAKAVHAFPHHHLKNIELMQELVVSIEHKFEGRDSARSFAILTSKRSSRHDNRYFGILSERLKPDRTALVLKRAAVKRIS